MVSNVIPFALKTVLSGTKWDKKVCFPAWFCSVYLLDSILAMVRVTQLENGDFFFFARFRSFSSVDLNALIYLWLIFITAVLDGDCLHCGKTCPG